MEDKSNKDEEKLTYTREEIENNISVPKVVVSDLIRIVEERLNQCGLYHRVFSRIKSPESLAHKYSFKDYDREDRKIQDLVGLRIDMYFEDDLAICQRLLEQSFELVNWSNSRSRDVEFKATKINGVFRLPEYLKEKISQKTWEMGIDDTFEIQLKTMFFEGWHEIEHDMRYKQEYVWKNRLSFSRHFNSILATLELCDKSMVTLLEDLGHDLYKEGQWTEMIRTHFRLKMQDRRLYPEVEQRFEESYHETVENLAKRVFKYSRMRLVEFLNRRNTRIPINVNTIVAIINENSLHDEKLTAIFKAHDVYNDGRHESHAGSRHIQLTDLLEHRVFQAEVILDTEKCGGDVKKTFALAAGYIQHWIKERFDGVVDGIPEEPSTYFCEQTGYVATMFFDGDEMMLRARTMHMDMEIAGRLWITAAQIVYRDGSLHFQTVNSYYDPSSENEDEKELYFSFPRFYKNITDNIGVLDVVRLSSGRNIVKKPEIPALAELVLDQKRMFPVVAIFSPEGQAGMMDESWLQQFRVSDFTKSVWRYAHVYTGYDRFSRKFFKLLGIDRAKLSDVSATEDAGDGPLNTDGVYIFWPGFTAGDTDQVLYYSPEDVSNCSFGRHREPQSQAHTFDIVKGGQAFYHKLLADIRDYNVMTKLTDESVYFDSYYVTHSRVGKKPIDMAGWEKLFREDEALIEDLIRNNQELVARNESLQKQVFSLKKKLSKYEGQSQGRDAGVSGISE